MVDGMMIETVLEDALGNLTAGGAPKQTPATKYST